MRSTNKRQKHSSHAVPPASREVLTKSGLKIQRAPGAKACERTIRFYDGDDMEYIKRAATMCNPPEHMNYFVVKAAMDRARLVMAEIEAKKAQDEAAQSAKAG